MRDVFSPQMSIDQINIADIKIGAGLFRYQYFQTTLQYRCLYSGSHRHCARLHSKDDLITLYRKSKIHASCPYLHVQDYDSDT